MIADLDTLKAAADAVATAAENTADVLRERVFSRETLGGDQAHLSAIEHAFRQLAVELREISAGEGIVRQTVPEAR